MWSRWRSRFRSTWLRRKCYAYIYGLDHRLREIGVQMTYCSLETEEIRRFTERYTPGRAGSVVLGPAGFLFQMGGFPGAVGTAQKRFHAGPGLSLFLPGGAERAWWRTSTAPSSGKSSFSSRPPRASAKTMSAVFPAVRAMGEGLGEKIFYLTAKTIARTVAEEAFSDSVLPGSGLQER